MVNSHRVSHPAIFCDSQNSLEVKLHQHPQKTYPKLNKYKWCSTIQRELSLRSEFDRGKEANCEEHIAFKQDWTVLVRVFLCPKTLNVSTQSLHLSNSK